MKALRACGSYLAFIIALWGPSAYNGYFECRCYHPLFCFNQYGDIERVHLRQGNVHSADEWRQVLEPIVNSYRGYDIPRFYRGDASFADPNLYSYLEGEGYFYAIRLKANAILYGEVEHLLNRPVGRPPKKPIVQYYSFRYQAASWDTARRVVAKVEWHAGELFPRIGFIVTNLRWKSANVVKFYNQRGTAEQWIKEGKYAWIYERFLFIRAYSYYNCRSRTGSFWRAFDTPPELTDFGSSRKK